MLLVTDRGHYFTVVEDFDDPDVLWVRSQDRQSIEHVVTVLRRLVTIPAEKADLELLDEPAWDYQFRVKLTRPLWAMYLEHVTNETTAHKLKPAVAEARGANHPISKLVEETFYYMSHNRPDGSLPDWLGGGKRKVTTRKIAK